MESGDRAELLRPGLYNELPVGDIYGCGSCQYREKVTHDLRRFITEQCHSSSLSKRRRRARVIVEKHVTSTFLFTSVIIWPPFWTNDRFILH